MLLYIWHFLITFQGIILSMLVENWIMRTINTSSTWHYMNNDVMEPVASVSILVIPSKNNPMPFINSQRRQKTSLSSTASYQSFWYVDILVFWVQSNPNKRSVHTFSSNRLLYDWRNCSKTFLFVDMDFDECYGTIQMPKHPKLPKQSTIW